MADFTIPSTDELLEFDLINAFCWVARTNNISRAAAHLNTSQPVITRKIGKLEKDLGVELFIRSNRGCELTPAGELLVSKVPGILLQIAQLRGEVCASVNAVTGLMVMGITHSAGAVMAPHILPAFAQRWPKLRVSLAEAVSRALSTRLLDRELSFAVLHDPPAHPDLVSATLLLEKVYLVGPPRLMAAPRLASPAVVDLVDLPLVMPSGQHTLRNLLDDAFAEIGVIVNPVYEATSVNMLRSMAAQGLGYALLTQGSVADDVAAGRLIARPLQDKGMSVALSLVTTHEQAKLRNVQLVSELVASEIRRVARAGLWPGNPTVVDSPLRHTAAT